MKKIYIVRHGETHFNITNRIQGWSDSDLTKNGITGIIKTAKELANINFNNIIFSSTSKRCVKTAILISDYVKVCNIQTLESLKEINLSIWEGKSADELKVRDADYDLYINSPHLFVPLSGESILDTQKRIVKAVKDILFQVDFENILIVTHSMAIRTLIAYLENITIEKIWSIDVPPASYKKIIFDDDLNFRRIE